MSGQYLRIISILGTWCMETLTTTAVQFPFRFLIPIPVLSKEVFVSNCNETFEQTVVKINKQRNTIKHAQTFFIERYVEDLTNWNLLTTLKSITLSFYFGSSFVMKIMGMEIKNVWQATRVFDCLRHNGSHND